MIILDSNVLSELMRERPDAQVLAWADAQAAGALWTTSICVFELHFSIARLAPGKRRDLLSKQVAHFESTILVGRILDFNSAAAIAAARYAANQSARGEPVDMRDVQIAGCVISTKGRLATRNTRHIPGLGKALINPWEAR